MLYLVATPIGNLGDLSPRAIEVLNTCDYVLCEDTRHSGRLFHHFEIKTPLRSFHKFSEIKNEHRIVEDLKNGIDIALISDAGMPTISDPGERLVAICLKEGISVTAIPGPCALLNALVLSGFPTQPFQFVGFLPKKRGDLKRALAGWLEYSGTSIAYVSPHQVKAAMEVFELVSPTRELALIREMTKVYEEVLHGFASNLKKRCIENPLKGELVLAISPPKENEIFGNLTPKEHSARLMEVFDLREKDAVKIVAKLRNIK